MQVQPSAGGGVPPLPSSPHPDDAKVEARIVDLVSRNQVKVPPYPAVAMKVEELVRKKDFGLAELAKLVASDQALAADALRCANSAFYSRGQTVNALSSAITRIGAKEVVRLALASGLGDTIRRAGPLSVLKRRVWLDALASAALSQELARARGLAADEAFTCGLLHDFGKVVAITCVEDILKGEKSAPRPAGAWLEIVERFHLELGLVLAAQWKLPELVSDVISLHHASDVAAAASPELVEVVATTDEVVTLLADHAWLTAEDLGAVSSLSTKECELLARVLERLPSLIAAFESGAAPPPGADLVQKPEPRFASEPKAVDFQVTVTVNREKKTYQATGITQSNLTLNGPAELPENVLFEVSLASTPAINCWATAKLSWPEGQGYTVLLQPFALTGDTARVWKELARPPEA